MAPFSIVIVDDLSHKVSRSLLSRSYPYTLESRAEDSFNSGASQPASSVSENPLPRIATESRRPTHTAGASWHNAHGPNTLKHLSIWAYLAFGFIVLWVSFVAIYACFRCCRANVVRLDTGDDENVQVWRRHSVAAVKRTRCPRRWGRKGGKEISAASSEVQLLRACGRSETNLSSATLQSMIIGSGRPIVIGRPLPSPGAISTATDSKCDFVGQSGVGSSPGSAVPVDLFNIPFALPRDSGSMSELWREPKLSPVRGSIIRPEPAVTVVSRKW